MCIVWGQDYKAVGFFFKGDVVMDPDGSRELIITST